MTRLQLGIYVPMWNEFTDDAGLLAGWPVIKDVAQQAESIGFDTLWVADHFAPQLPDGSIQSLWEAWTLLGALTQVTHRMTLGPLISPAAFRAPALLAKMAMTIDEVSAGRLILGLGVGSERELGFALSGLPIAQRASIFAEALEIIVPALRTGYVDFTGKHVQARDFTLVLRGPQRSGPAIWIGAKGPRMVGLAARWADSLNYNAPLQTLDAVTSAIAQRDVACQEVGRDPATLALSGYVFISFAQPTAVCEGIRQYALRGSPDALAAQLQALHHAGVEHLTVVIDDGTAPVAPAFPPPTALGLDLFMPVIAALRDLERG